MLGVRTLAHSPEFDLNQYNHSNQGNLGIQHQSLPSAVTDY
jgi:hypothetical protein